MKVFLSFSPWRVLLLSVFLFSLSAPAAGHSEDKSLVYAPMPAGEIARLQRRVSALPVGERIAFWAESFIGAPYDTDPLGAYVRSRRAVCDNRVDCMYLVFRAVELATSDTPRGAVERALTLRFRTRGIIKDGVIVNYDDRYAYAEDMVFSGKWGENITGRLGHIRDVPGTRGRARITYLPRDELLKPGNYARLRSGDLVFFVKDPARRVAGEVVGHLGVIRMKDGRPFLIHASGSKSSPGHAGGGVVKEVDLPGYLSGMSFIGVMVTRFPNKSR